MIDPVDVVRQVAPPLEAPPELLERVRNDLMTTIILSQPDETRRPSRRHRRWERVASQPRHRTSADGRV